MRNGSGSKTWLTTSTRSRRSEEHQSQLQSVLSHLFPPRPSSDLVEHGTHRTAPPAGHYRHAGDVIAAGVASDSRPGGGIARVHAPLGIVRLAGQHGRLGARHDEIGDDLVDAERLRIKDVADDKYAQPTSRRGAARRHARLTRRHLRAAARLSLRGE